MTRNNFQNRIVYKDFIDKYPALNLCKLSDNPYFLNNVINHYVKIEIKKIAKVIKKNPKLIDALNLKKVDDIESYFLKKYKDFFINYLF